MTSTWQYILRTPYWWPTRRRDVLEYCQDCPVCKIADPGDETGNLTPHEFNDDDDLILVKTLEAKENMIEGEESDWTTPYFRYLTYATYRTPWVTCLPKAERELIAYRSQFFILKEGELHRIFHNNIIKKCMPGRYVRSYIKTLHIQENRHFSINATKQLVLQGPYWWPTIAEDISIFITLCTDCNKQGEELPTEVNSSKPGNGTDIMPYKETFNNWRTPLIENLAHGKFKLEMNTQRGQRKIVRDSEYFTLEKRKLQKLGKDGTTKICIAGYQIKHWIRKMHIYQQRHLTYQQTLLRCLQGNRWWPTMGLCDIQLFLSYDCPSCCRRFDHIPENIICGSIIAQSHDNKDWRRLLIEYLIYGYLKGSHISKKQYKKMARQSQEYFIEEGKLKRILSNGDIKICIAGCEVNEYLRELHIIESGEHLSMETMWHLVMLGPYCWPTCGADIKNLCNWECPVCSNQAEPSKDKQTQSPLGQKDIQKTITRDWRQPYMEYLTCRKIFTKELTPEDKSAIEQSHKYFALINGTLQMIRKGGKSNQLCILATQVPMYLDRIHGENKPHSAAIETWKAVATGAYWWPTWVKDVCNHLRHCKICKGTEARENHLEESQNSFQQETAQDLDWRVPIIQQLNSVTKLNHMDTQKELGSVSIDMGTYVITGSELKYRLPDGKVKMCVTQEDAYDWVKRIHEYQIPHLIREEILAQVHKGPYWWPTISPDVEHVINECKTCQFTKILDPKINDYGTIIFPTRKTHDWREPIIQHLKNPMKLSNFAYHKSWGCYEKNNPITF